MVLPLTGITADWGELPPGSTWGLVQGLRALGFFGFVSELGIQGLGFSA